MNNMNRKDVAKAETAFTRDESMRYKYMLREKAIRDYYSGLADAKQEGMEIGQKQGIEIGEKRGREMGIAEGKAQGLAQGREQGLAQGLAQAIIGMLRHNLEPEYIAQILQCPVEKVEQIAKECQSSI